MLSRTMTGARSLGVHGLKPQTRTQVVRLSSAVAPETTWGIGGSMSPKKDDATKWLGQSTATRSRFAANSGLVGAGTTRLSLLSSQSLFRLACLSTTSRPSVEVDAEGQPRPTPVDPTQERLEEAKEELKGLEKKLAKEEMLLEQVRAKLGALEDDDVLARVWSAACKKSARTKRTYPTADDYAVFLQGKETSLLAREDNLTASVNVLRASVQELRKEVVELEKVSRDLLRSSDGYTGLRELFAEKQFAASETNGIDMDKFFLERENLVKEVIDTASECGLLIVGSAPATGKTSLMQLVMRKVKADPRVKVKVCYMTGIPDGAEAMFAELARVSGINLRDEAATRAAMEPYDQVWVIIDDAQEAYNDSCAVFWRELVKGRRARLGGLGNRIRFVVAATYYLHDYGSPVALQSEVRLSTPLTISAGEADALFASFAVSKLRTADWGDFKDELKMVSDVSKPSVGSERQLNISIGVFMMGLRMMRDEALSVASRSGVEPLTEDAARGHLRGDAFLVLLKRCFVGPKRFDPEHRGIILDTIVRGENRAGKMENLVKPVDEVVVLVRGGILRPGGEFTSLAARWYYYSQCFPRRAAFPPSSIDDLVTQAVRSMSAMRLRGLRPEGKFPKEAAFQQLFNEAMTEQLPPGCNIIPELNTKAEVDGETTSGELDFYINGDLRWALELLREGSRVGEHLARFHPTSGKYRTVPANAYLVVDCRGPRQNRPAKLDVNRCTLYFSEDFTSCECQMRDQPAPTVLSLQP